MKNKKKIIILTVLGLLFFTIFDFISIIKPTEALEKITFREYMISLLEDKGYSIPSNISDNDLFDIINFASEDDSFDKITIPEGLLKDLDYLPTALKATDFESVVVTIPPEFDYDYLHTIFAPGTDCGINKYIKITADIYNIEDSFFDIVNTVFEPNPKYYSNKTENFWFIDAIPNNFYLPIPYIFNTSIHNGIEYSALLGIRGYKDPSDSQGLKVIRNNDSIKVEIENNSFDSSLIRNENSALSLITRYAIGLTSKDEWGNDIFGSMATTSITDITVKYSVSIEPITVGAKNGKPILTGYENSAKASYPKYSQYPGETDPGRPLSNSTTNINRGMNSITDSSGSNSAGADIRGLSNNDGTFSSTTYTAGGSDPDKIATEKIHTGTTNGTRTIGFASYGNTNISVDNNADSIIGYEVDYYEAEVFHPITGESIGWIQKNGSINNTKAKLTENQINDYLSNVGISGKTKIYVAYRKKVSFIKTDNKISHNALTASLIGEQNLPSFTLYKDSSCTHYAIDSNNDGNPTIEENVFSYNILTGEVTSPGIPNLLEDENTSKTYYMKETAPGFEENGKIYTLKIDKNGIISFDTTEGFVQGENYILPNTPLPVNINFNALNYLNGETNNLVDNQFKFILKQTESPSGISKLIPESGIIGYNKADGTINFNSTLSFLEPGIYKFTLNEDPSYRKSSLTEKDYSDITFDEAERIITVVVRWANITNNDNLTEKGLKAIISVKNGIQEENIIDIAYGKDTNPISNVANIKNINLTSFFNKKLIRYNLSVSNTIVGIMVDKTKEFNFELKLTGDNIPTVISYVKGNDIGTITLVNGVGLFKLAHEETITLMELPEGCNYEITEKDGISNGYTVSSTNDKNTLNNDTSVSFVNSIIKSPFTGDNLNKYLMIFMTSFLFINLMIFTKLRLKKIN